MRLRQLLRAAALFAPLLAGAQSPVASPFREQRFLSAGVPITFVDTGTGPVVVLLHGNGSNLRRWQENGVLQALAPNYRVIAYDARGHGLSGKPHDPAAYGREYALDVVRLLDHLKVPRAHIVGYSMGAMTTVELLTLHPERVITAVLGGAAGRISPTAARDAQYEEEAAERDRDCISRSQVNRLNPAGAPPMTDSAFRAQRDACLANPFMDGKALAASSRSSMGRVITQAQVAAIRVPLLGIVGSRDPYLDDFRKFAQWNPSLVLVTVQDGTHYTVMYDGAPMSAAIRTWLGVHRGDR